MTIPKPCLICGTPTEDTSRCPDCTPPTHALSATRRGYDAAWRRLSTRARRLQPWCTDFGTVEDLTTDHSIEAWQQREEGKEITLDLIDVVCRSCNGKRGRARPTSTSSSTTPGRSPSTGPGPLGKPHPAIHTPGGIQ